MTELNAPVRFASAADLAEDVRALVCNGIGPARGRTWCSNAAWALSLFPLGVASAFGLTQAFREAGDDHDLHYFMGGGRREKRLADGVFLGQLLDTVSHWGWLLRPLGWAVAVSYWVAVAAFGRGSYQKRYAPLSLEDAERRARLDLAQEALA